MVKVYKLRFYFWRKYIKGVFGSVIENFSEIHIFL